MNFDFAFFLLAGSVITGVIWALDYWVWAPKRRYANPHEYSGDPSLSGVEKGPKEPLIVEYSKSFFPVLLVVFLLRGFVAEPFRIPSGSMIPTLYIGDFILVNKFAYGLRMPVFNEKIIETGEPQRGDVVVFRYPRDPSVDYIKRLVGLPGDHIAYYNKVLYINGKPIKREYVGEYKGPGENNPANEYTEDLLGVKHQMLLIPQRPGFNAEYIVPEGHYFMMGDNRDNSNDSRYWGVVADKYIIGKAFMIWMSLENGTLTDGIAWDRIGTTIK